MINDLKIYHQISFDKRHHSLSFRLIPLYIETDDKLIKDIFIVIIQGGSQNNLLSQWYFFWTPCNN